MLGECPDPSSPCEGSGSETRWKWYRNPASYRGIALQSVVLKVLCNVRLPDWSETNYILSDEQNCFRPDCSCLDHLFVICSVIGARKLNKLPTFVAFVDLRKAFDSVDGDLLWYRL